MRKSNLLKLGLVAVSASMLGTSANADVIDGNATANVIAPLLLNEVTPLSFGTVAGGTTAGTVVVTTAGATNAFGGATSLASAPGAPGAFTIQGAAAQAYTLTVTGTATLGSPSGTMTADTFTNNAGALTGGVDAFSVGGTLNVGISQAADFYSTLDVANGGIPFTVTANYD